MAVIPKTITDILKKVVFPGTTDNIVDLEMVQEIRTAGSRISFTLVFGRDTDPNIKAVSEACVAEIESALGTDYDLLITPKGKHRMSAPVLPGVKNIIAVASGKGGVGKSTVAANLAVALAKAGGKVGLIDADIFGPSIPKMFGEEETQPLMESIEGRDMIIPIEKFGVKILSIGFFGNKDNALVWRGPVASNALKQLILQGMWGDLDYLLIDLPPGTSDIHLTIVQTLPVTGSVIVTTPQDIALVDVIKGVSMFRSKAIEVPVLGIVENMSWFTPSELPDHKYYIFGKDGGKNLAQELDLPFLGQIPIVMSIREGGDSGIPVAWNDDTATADAFRILAANVIEQLDYRNENLRPTERVRIKKS
jgi:ATP-binding protein involved in chromosome partitioning